jgi:hypothetical protein
MLEGIKGLENFRGHDPGKLKKKIIIIIIDLLDDNVAYHGYR